MNNQDHGEERDPRVRALMAQVETLSEEQLSKVVRLMLRLNNDDPKVLRLMAALNAGTINVHQFLERL